MPSTKKNKSKKHVSDGPIVYSLLDGQMYGRVTKLMGGCNVMVYCNDDAERLCHIRGNMRNKVWINVGDIVLVSFRDCDEKLDRHSRGDICAKYDQRVIYKLQGKDKSVNPKLFTMIEKVDMDGNNGGVPDSDDAYGFLFNLDRNAVVEGDAKVDLDEL